MAFGAGMMGRRGLLQGAAAGGAMLALGGGARAAAGPDLKAIRGEIDRRHDEAVQRLQTWIRQPSICAENRGMEEDPMGRGSAPLSLQQSEVAVPTTRWRPPNA